MCVCCFIIPLRNLGCCVFCSQTEILHCNLTVQHYAKSTHLLSCRHLDERSNVSCLYAKYEAKPCHRVSTETGNRVKLLVCPKATKSNLDKTVCQPAEGFVGGFCYIQTETNLPSKLFPSVYSLNVKLSYLPHRNEGLIYILFLLLRSLFYFILLLKISGLLYYSAHKVRSCTVTYSSTLCKMCLFASLARFT